MQYIALLISAIGHACWDNILSWMVLNDPDASLLHMLWIRMFIISFILCSITFFKKIKIKHSWKWWFKFSIVGWVIPNIAYSISVLWTGYRISVSFQPFIPLLVAIRTKKKLTVQHCSALILTLTGTFFIWVSVEWKHELWMIWFALIASIIQVLCLTEWFVMLDKLKENQFLYIVRGITLSVCIMFIVMIIWTPQHLEAAFVYRTDSWFFIMVASSITISCKYWVLSYFLKNMSSDSVAIFECIHPIATLCLEVFKGHTKFEWQDIVSICLYTMGWILYPK